MAATSAARLRKKVRHPWLGGPRRLTMYLAMLDCATSNPSLIRGDWIRPGAIVIDVGINRVADGTGKTRLIVDVAFAEALNIAGAITPVPGWVGPTTISCLLRNCLAASLAPPFCKKIP